MPHIMWVHNCKKLHNGSVGLGVEVCPDCGEHGQYDGWHFSVVESMCAYHQRTGLAPFGPHRALADKLITPHMKACEQCKGIGVIDVENGKSWKDCPTCHGAQYLFDGTEKELEALRQKIYIAFPDVKPGAVSTKGTNAEAPSVYQGGGFFRATDKSLEAYKAWILGTFSALTGREDDGSISEEEWEAGWKKFWKKGTK